MDNWRKNLYLCWFAQLLCILGFSCVFSFLPFYVQELGVTDPDQVKLWAGWISAGGSISMAIFAPIWGGLADRYGRKIMVERAAFGGVVILCLMAFITSPTQLLVLRTIQGTLTGTIAAFTTLVASTTPRGQEGYSLGLMQVAVFSGSSGGPLLGGFIADTLGYRATFLVAAGFLLIGGLLVIFFVQDNFQPRKRHRQSLLAQARSVIGNPIVMAMVLLLFSLNFTSMIIRPILPLFVQELEAGSGRLATLTGSIQGGMAVTSAIAAAFIGRLADRVGHRRVLIIAGVGAAIAYFPMMFAQSALLLFLLSLVVGVFLGGLLPISNALIALNVAQEEQGATYGLTASSGAAGRALGPLIGSFAAVQWGTRSLFPLGAALYLITAIGIGSWISDSHSVRTEDR